MSRAPGDRLRGRRSPRLGSVRYCSGVNTQDWLLPAKGVPGRSPAASSDPDADSGLPQTPTCTIILVCLRDLDRAYRPRITVAHRAGVEVDRVDGAAAEPSLPEMVPTRTMCGHPQFLAAGRACAIFLHRRTNSCRVASGHFLAQTAEATKLQPRSAGLQPAESVHSSPTAFSPRSYLQ
jgi:hypothetical protein